MSSSADSLSVVICAYTEARWLDLQAAVASVQGQVPQPCEVIVVTDYNDALLARARAELTGARVVPNTEAQGLSGARNTGVAAASGAIVAFLDDDATARPGWIEHLLAPYADPDVLGVGGRVIPAWDEARPSWLPAEFDWVVGCTYAGHRDRPGPVRNLIGANMSVRRSVVTEIGGFRHSLGRTASLPAGCEETEFFIRATQHFPDGVIWYEPDAAVSHRVPATRTTAKYFRARCFAEGISKTQISRIVGARDGLASERAYTTRAVPRAFVREVGRATLRLDSAGLARAATLVTGVTTTAGGYAAARVPGSDRWLPSRNGAPAPARSKKSRKRKKVRVNDGYVPALVTQIDIADGARPLAALDPERGITYRRAVVLVRRDTTPLGILEVSFGSDGLTAEECATEIEAALGVRVPTSPTRTSDDIVVREPVAASVVIATRDRVESLARCLDSLERLEHPAAEIIVVDNASAGPATRDLVLGRSRRDPRIRYVREERPGLARAHNAAMDHVTTPIVAFTDDDVVVDPGWLGGIVDGFSRQANVGCVTGMIFPLELETAAQDWIEHYAGFNKGFEPRIFELRPSRPAADPLFPYTAGAFGSGANMAFRTDVLRAMHGFEPALGAGSEAKGGDDLAAFFDVISAGHAIAYEPGAIVYHQHHETFEALHHQAFGYGAGLTAFLTRAVVERPSRALDMLVRAPRAIHHAFGASSAKNARLPESSPAALVRRERLGMLAGPALYFLSRWDARLDARPGEVGELIVLDEPTPVVVAEVEPADVDLVEVELREASVAQ